MEDDMRSRTFQLIFSLLVIFVFLAMVSISYSLSYAQSDGGRRVLDDRGKTGQRVNAVQRYNQLLQEMKNKGYDVSEAMKLDEKARIEMNQGNRREARRLLREAIATLEALETGTSYITPSCGGKETGRVIEIPVSSSKVYVTEAVPSPESGKKIKDYNGAFVTRTVSAQGGMVSLILTGTPVYIEEQPKADRGSSLGLEDSPFGISIAGFCKEYDSAMRYMKDVGAGWVRFLGKRGGLVWDFVEVEKGSYDWSASDDLYAYAQSHGLNIMVNVYPINSWDQPEIEVVSHRIKRRPGRYPSDMDSYLKFVRKSVERYNGDGSGDAPGSPTINGWIIGCEMESHFRWVDTPKNYARLFIETYKIIKKCNPESTVLLYGSNFEKNRREGLINTFTIPMLKEVKKLSRDLSDMSFVFSLHHYKASPAGLIDNIIKAREILDAAGFNEVPIWMTDAATFSAGSQGGNRFRSEKKLAQDIIKLYSSGLAHGIKKYVWAQISDGYRSNSLESGLIGKDRGTKTKYKKLAYYTYKLMTEKLGCLKRNATKILHEGENGTYVYAFKNRQGRTIYVAWADFDGNH
jgi:hypothetical protein